MDNTKILVQKDLDKINWQSTTEAIQFVVDNYEIIDEVGQFNVYEIK